MVSYILNTKCKWMGSLNGFPCGRKVPWLTLIERPHAYISLALHGNSLS